MKWEKVNFALCLSKQKATHDDVDDDKNERCREPVCVITYKYINGEK